MARKPFPWHKPTPTQVGLIERLVAAGGALPYGKLEHPELVAFDELLKLKLVDMQAAGRSKLQAVLKDAGRALRDAGYRTQRVIVRGRRPGRRPRPPRLCLPKRVLPVPPRLPQGRVLELGASC